MGIVNMYDRDVEIFYDEQILENKKEYSKSWSKILQVILEIDNKQLGPGAPGSSASGFDMTQQHGMKLKDKERQIIKDKFHVRFPIMKDHSFPFSFQT